MSGENLTVAEHRKREDEARVRDVLAEKDVRVAYLDGREFRSFLCDTAMAMAGFGALPPVPDGMPMWTESLAQHLVGDVQVDPELAKATREALCEHVGHLRRFSFSTCGRCGADL